MDNKVVKMYNWRVVVYCGNYPWQDQIREAERIIDEIKRHVDYGGSVTIEHDTETKCVFCYSIWEVGEDGSPVCCDRAIEEWESEKKSG